MAEKPEPYFDRLSDNNAVFTRIFPASDVLKRKRASRAETIILSPQLQMLNQSEINTLFQNLSQDLSWMEVKEIGLRYQNVMPNPSPVRESIIWHGELDYAHVRYHGYNKRADSQMGEL
jgi:hypothetical protein